MSFQGIDNKLTVEDRRDIIILCLKSAIVDPISRIHINRIFSKLAKNFQKKNCDMKKKIFFKSNP
jgi:hypothetical protein